MSTIYATKPFAFRCNLLYCPANLADIALHYFVCLSIMDFGTIVSLSFKIKLPVRYFCFYVVYDNNFFAPLLVIFYPVNIVAKSLLYLNFQKSRGYYRHVIIYNIVFSPQGFFHNAVGHCLCLQLPSDDI